MSKKIYMVGSSHITQWLDDINHYRITALPNVTMWGEAEFVVFSQRMYDNILAQLKAGFEIWLLVPDFRFCNSTSNKYKDFTDFGTDRSNEFSAIDRGLITPDHDHLIYEHTLKILDELVAACQGQIKMMFWYLAVRERQNINEGKYVDGQGVYHHPLWNYQDMHQRYADVFVDIWPMTNFLDSYTIDSQCYPSVKAQSYIYNSFLSGNGSQSLFYSEYVYQKEMYELSDLAANSYSVSHYAFTKVDFLNSSTVFPLIGGNDTLFLAGDSNSGLRQHYGFLRHNKIQEQHLRTMLEGRKEFLSKKNIKTINLVAPDKQTVYYDRLPLPIQADHQRPSARFMKISAEIGIKTCFPITTLIQQKEAGHEVYDKGDSHWNAHGAFYAYKSLIDQINVECNEQLETIELEDISFYSVKAPGDLGEKTSPIRSFDGTRMTLNQPMSELIFDSSRNTTLHNIGTLKIYTNQSKQKKLIMFGDSFNTMILPFLAESFGTVIFLHSANFDFNLIAAEQPDIVIYQSVERFLYNAPSDTKDKIFIDLVFDKIRSIPASQLQGMILSYNQQPESFYKNLYLGLTFLALKKHDLACGYLETCYAQNSKLTPLIKYLCLSYFRNGAYQKSHEMFKASFNANEDVFSLRPFIDDLNNVQLYSQVNAKSGNRTNNWLYPYYQVAFKQISEKNHAIALTYLLKIAETGVESSAIEYLIGKCHIGLGKLDESIPFLLRSHHIDQYNQEPITIMSNIFYQKNEFLEAINYLEKILLGNNTNTDLYFKIGVCNLRLGNVPLAIQFFQDALQIKPDLDSAYVQLGVCYRKLADFSSAKSCYEQALSINPNNISGKRELDLLPSKIGGVKI